MKHNNSHQTPGQTPASPPKPTAAELQQGARNFVPAADEVARRAYFSYVNQGSKSGHEVQHWLKAEADMIAERNRTREHGYHNPT